MSPVLQGCQMQREAFTVSFLGGKQEMKGNASVGLKCLQERNGNKSSGGK